MPLYRKKPVEVEAWRWDGTNLEFLQGFTGQDFFGYPMFYALDDDDRAQCDDPDATAQVYDKLHSTWVLVYDGDFIIKGILGEFYPCREFVFRETYEWVEV